MSYKHVALVLCLVYAATSALPQELTTPAENVTTPAPVPSVRQARADLSSLARFVTPDNLATVKSLFTGLGTYGATGLSNVLSFNLSNVVIIVLLAGLAILIAPAVLSLFGLGALGTNFGRSLGLDSNGQLQNADRVYRALDSFFQTYNIDAKTCLQRFACTASRSSSSAVRQGNPSYVDSALNYVLNSSYGNTILDKTSLLDAVTYGQQGGDCEIQYGKCPFSWDKVAQYIPFSGFNLFGASSTTQSPIQTPQDIYKRQ